MKKIIRFFNFFCGKPSEMANNDRKQIPIFVAPRCGAICYVSFFSIVINLLRRYTTKKYQEPIIIIWICVFMFACSQNKNNTISQEYICNQIKNEIGLELPISKSFEIEETYSTGDYSFYVIFTYDTTNFALIEKRVLQAIKQDSLDKQNKWHVYPEKYVYIESKDDSIKGFITVNCNLSRNKNSLYYFYSED